MGSGAWGERRGRSRGEIQQTISRLLRLQLVTQQTPWANLDLADDALASRRRMLPNEGQENFEDLWPMWWEGQLGVGDQRRRR